MNWRPRLRVRDWWIIKAVVAVLLAAVALAALPRAALDAAARLVRGRR